MPLTEAVKVLHRRGLAHLNERNAAAAIPLFREVLAQVPDSVDTWDHLAAALTMQGAFEEAEAAFQACFKLGCSFPETMHNAVRNAALWNKPQLQLEHARRLLELDGELRQAGLRYAAEALRNCGRPLDALAACRQLLLELPGNFAARQLCVRPLLETGQGDAAAALCEELLAEQPDNISLRLSQIEATIATGDMEGGIRHAEALLALDPDNLDAMSALGFHYQYLADMTVAQRRAHAERYAAMLRKRAAPYREWPNARDSERVLHIGLVSGDLRHHPVAFFMRSLLEALKDSSLRFYVYDTLEQHDALTEQIRPLIARWHDVKGKGDRELAELVRADKIDILLDLHGYTTGNRLPMMALKPAPVQMSWLGFLGSTGTPGMDYVIADAHGVPPGEEHEFTEKVWRLPDCAQCFTPPDLDCPVTPPPVLTNGFITFGCLNKPHKINDRVLALWSRVLARLPDSRLLLRGNGFGSPPYRERFIARLKALGIDPTRVMLEGPAPRAQFLNAYSRIDIALDPFPYSGGTTTAESLWVGVPVLALRGDRMVWRMSYSFMAAAGLGDWAADDADSFVELAVAKAKDIEALVALRRIQREQVLKSPLCDAARFATNVEEALREVWREYLSSAT